MPEENKIKRTYFMKIKNYSSKELETMFVNHISKDSDTNTDQWKEYVSLKKHYQITQSNSNNVLNFKLLHTMTH